MQFINWLISRNSNLCNILNLIYFYIPPNLCCLFYAIYKSINLEEFKVVQYI